MKQLVDIRHDLNQLYSKYIDEMDNYYDHYDFNRKCFEESKDEADESMMKYWKTLFENKKAEVNFIESALRVLRKISRIRETI